jgi:hypothetical protein
MHSGGDSFRLGQATLPVVSVPRSDPLGFWSNEEAAMNVTLSRMLVWAPRVLGIMFALFLSIFALDVFGAGYSFWESILAFLIHQVPVFVLLIAIVLAWRGPWIGAVVFLAFAAWYLANNWTPAAIYANLVIAGPSLLIGVLYLAAWLTSRQMTAKLTHS